MSGRINVVLLALSAVAVASMLPAVGASISMGQYDEYANLQCTGAVLRTLFVPMGTNPPPCTVWTDSSAHTNTFVNNVLAVCFWMNTGCTNTAQSCFTATNGGCVDPADGTGKGRIYTWPVYADNAWVKLNLTTSCGGGQSGTSYFPIGVCLDIHRPGATNYDLYTYPTATTMRVCTYTNAQCNSAGPVCGTYSTLPGRSSCTLGTTYSRFIAGSTPQPPPTPPPTPTQPGGSNNGGGSNSSNGGGGDGLVSDSTGLGTSDAGRQTPVSVATFALLFAAAVNLW